jgi:crotonobetainyl-CoA:carnitine CoA-transferase CaiB-like acyl-CoA transferase
LDLLLEPYRVLDLTDEPGLLAGKILADLGADVIQVEPPGGSRARQVPPFLDGDASRPEYSAYWAAYACNKRGITCDTDRPEGRALVRRLAATADFLFESDAPGAMAARGLGYDDLAAVNPALVYVSITPFGQTGPKAGYAHSDLVLWAAGGPLAISGTLPVRDGDRPPVRVTVPQADLHAAGDAAGGALLAHFARLQDGLGQHVDVSVQQSVTIATLSQVLAASVGDKDSTRGAPLGRTRWRVRDGWVDMVLGWAANGVFQWMREEGACSDADAALDWGYMQHMLDTGQVSSAEHERLVGLVEAFLTRWTKQELLDASARRKLQIAPVFRIDEVAGIPHYAARDFWQTAEGDAAGLRYPGPFVRMTGHPIRYRRPAPRPGEHNREVYVGELGLSEAEFARLCADGVIGDGPAAAHAEPRPSRAPVPPGTAARPPNPGTRHPVPGARLPLSGLKVLDLTWVAAGPTVSRVLADYGATVVHVESSRRIETARRVGPNHGGVPGVEASALYGNMNAGKLGLTLDLSQEAGRDTVRDLVRWADVVAESYTPGVMRRWGLDYEALRRIKTDLIMLSTSLTGQTGPYATLSGYGTFGAGMSGFQDLVGWPDRPPLGPSGPYTDYVAPRFSLAAMLAALDHRRRTGEGCYIDQAQAESAMHFLAPVYVDYFATGRVAERAGNRDPRMAPHGVYPCKDEGGRTRSARDGGEVAGGDQIHPSESWVAVAVRTDEEWSRLAALIDGPALAADPRFTTAAGRLAHADLLDEIMAAWTAERTAAEVETLLQDRGIPAHAALTSAEAASDPQLRERGHFVTLSHPLHGTTVVEGSRYRLSRTPAVISRCAPTLGRDNEHVLRGILGYDDERMVELAVAGVLE